MQTATASAAAEADSAISDWPTSAAPLHFRRQFSLTKGAFGPAHGRRETTGPIFLANQPQLNHSIWRVTMIMANRLLSACSTIVSAVLPLRWRSQPSISPIRKMQRIPIGSYC
jgi:hypothetical protein